MRFNTPDNIMIGSSNLHWRDADAIPFFMLSNGKIIECPKSTTHNDFIETKFADKDSQRTFINSVIMQGRYWKKSNVFAFWNIDSDSDSCMKYIINKMSPSPYTSKVFYNNKILKLKTDDRGDEWFDSKHNYYDRNTVLDDSKKAIIEHWFNSDMNFIKNNYRMAEKKGNKLSTRSLNKHELLSATCYQLWADFFMNPNSKFNKFTLDELSLYVTLKYKGTSFKELFDYFHKSMRKKMVAQWKENEYTSDEMKINNEFEELMSNFGFSDTEYTIINYENTDEPYSCNVKTEDYDKAHEITDALKSSNDFIVDRCTSRKISDEIKLYSFRIRKKFKMQEHANILKEYHEEPRLPFEEFGNGHAYMDEFIDWIQYSSKKGELPKPSITWEEGIKKGCEEYSKISTKYIPSAVLEVSVEKHGMFKYPQFDENGNLYVERMLGMPIGSVNQASPELYERLIQDYEDNVGGCWSWILGEAEAYCGTMSGDKIAIKLCGYMCLDDIYWAELIRKATDGYFKNEYEVRTYPRGRVMLTKIEFTDNEGKYIADAASFDGPRILKQTYFGNNEYFRGDYAKLGYQKIGYDKDYIDRQGNEYTKDELKSKGHYLFDKIYDYVNGFAIVKLDDTYNFIDKNGNLLYKGDEWFDKVKNFENGFAKVSNYNLYNMLNQKGELIWKGDEWLDDIYSFSDGFALVLTEKGVNYIDENGELLWKGDTWFEDGINFFDGLAQVANEDYRYNYLNDKGQLISDIWFDSASRRFHNGFAVILIDDKGYNYIDENGELLFHGDEWFDNADDFFHETATVKFHGEKYQIDTKGHLTKDVS